MSTDVSDFLNLEYPIIQAAMGGGVANAKLVCAVSNSGGLGSLGFSDADTFEQEIISIKHTLNNRPYSVNLLMPFVTRAHVRCCIKHKVPVVSIFYGYKKGLIPALQRAGCKVAYQIGSLADAEHVVANGADFLIVQGNEAGGHLCGQQPLAELLPLLKEHFNHLPIVAAGGIHDAVTARHAISLGANGVCCGTRFLMSEESGAHPLYKKKLVESQSTLVTKLFGLGWHAQHRVLKNHATEKWLNGKGVAPLPVSIINQGAGLLSKYFPTKFQDYLFSLQRPGIPFYTPILPNHQMQNPNMQCSALYAGECVSQLTRIAKTEDIISEVGRAFT